MTASPISPMVIAHRGDSANAPENTLVAFQSAIASGADGVEFDVRLSKDGVPVVIHDRDTRRTTGVSMKVDQSTAKELRRLDAGSWFVRARKGSSDVSLAHARIPSLAEVLDLYRSQTGPIYVELKYDDLDVEPMAKAVAEVCSDFHGIMDRVIVKSFRLAAIPAIRHLLPEIQTAALFEPSIMNILRGRKHMVAIAAEFGARQMSLHYSLASRSTVGIAAECGMPVTIWTVDDPRWILMCRQRGIGSLIANDPGTMLAARR